MDLFCLKVLELTETWCVLDKQRCASSVALSYALLSLNMNYEELKMLIGTRK